MSSMLMYGAVRIHQKQVEHLFGEYIGPGRKSCTCPLCRCMGLSESSRNKLNIFLVSIKDLV